MSCEDDIKALKARVKALEEEPSTHQLLLDLERRTEDAMQLLATLADTSLSALFEIRRT